MELRLPLEVFPGRQATCRAVFGTWGSFPDDARASHCPFVLTSFIGWSSKRCPGIGFLSRGDREIGVLRKDRKSTRLNSSHHSISYAVFCLKKKKKKSKKKGRSVKKAEKSVEDEEKIDG